MTTGVTFTAIGVRPFAAGVKTATEGSDLRPLWLSVTAAPILPWHSPKNKQGIPTTPNMPKPLVFSGFPNILFIPCVPNKRFTFRHRKPCCLWRFPLHNVTGFPFVSVCLSFPARSHRPSATCNIKLHCMLFLRSALS